MKTKVFLVFLLVVSCSHNKLKNGKEHVELELFDVVINPHDIFSVQIDSSLSSVELSCDDKAFKRFEVKNSSIVIKNDSSLGLHVCTLRPDFNSPFYGESTFNLLVTTQKKPTIIVDIDHTIADVSPVEFLFSDYTEIKQLPNSSMYLNLLAKEYQIVYLTARNEIFKNHTTKWLSYNKFPKGPVLFWNLTDDPFFDVDYKTLEISKLKNKVKNIPFAVGDKKSDALAYTSNNLNAIIISENLDLKEKVVFVSSWDEIYKFATK